jgi:hypothetical protein
MITIAKQDFINNNQGIISLPNPGGGLAKHPDLSGASAIINKINGFLLIGKTSE